MPQELTLPRGQARLGGDRRSVYVHIGDFTVTRGGGRIHEAIGLNSKVESVWRRVGLDTKSSWVGWIFQWGESKVWEGRVSQKEADSIALYISESEGIRWCGEKKRKRIAQSEAEIPVTSIR